MPLIEKEFIIKQKQICLKLKNERTKKDQIIKVSGKSRHDMKKMKDWGLRQQQQNEQEREKKAVESVKKIIKKKKERTKRSLGQRQT